MRCIKCKGKRLEVDFFTDRKGKRDTTCKKCRLSKSKRLKVINRRALYGSGTTPQRLAHHAVSKAIKDGVLVRGACEVCGTDKLVHGHHESYDEDKRLDVKWLCHTHHRELHNSKELA